MNKEYNCPNVVCRNFLRWRNGIKQSVAFEVCESVKKYENENGTFKYLTCLKVFLKQSNASWHSKPVVAELPRGIKPSLYARNLRTKVF